jgi:hypothetical protein
LSLTWIATPGRNGTTPALSAAVMHGYVTTRHLVTHGAIIVREFGWRVYFRCLVNVLAGSGQTTFLQALR